MKRIISSVLILALLCCINNISFAEEIEDSLNISKEELEILQPLEGYPVYKIYREEIMLFFGSKPQSANCQQFAQNISID